MTDHSILTESGINSQGRPFVNVRWPALESPETQWTPDEARAFAFNILSAAEAADHDAAFFKWATDGPLDLEPRQGAQMLHEQRRYREMLNGG